ncbi:Uncharacterised protein [Enterobacter ludwigii]|uniref:hypothetical protein n=1 Tax=Enterobacteriaceae TaxID=543 RepID=UPI00066A3497|nr:MULTISPECIES: hypothetical protein [Enterobacterales]MDU7481578.1 hypothetical protein [Hafnia alvei]VAG36940.1 Uncharacterised protein [Enterobacter ludwigii]VAG79942.1 Uncharacterised protein [Enterobacter ludwigii]
MILSQIIYRHFLKFVELKSQSFSLESHETFLKCNDNTDLYYCGYYSVKEPTPPYNDETCKSCKNHFLAKRPNIDHDDDIVRGIGIEVSFMNYLNFIFKIKKTQLECKKADVEYKNMPDLKIEDKYNGEVLFYIEMKSIFKPFVKINSLVSSDFYCNSHSLTLDSDEKLEKQFNLIESNEIQDKTIYVYWYDIPCLKGIFWSTYRYVLECKNTQREYIRQAVKGDYRENRKSGHIQKIYLNIKEMSDFESLITCISGQRIIPQLKINDYSDIEKYLISIN